MRAVAASIVASVALVASALAQSAPAGNAPLWGTLEPGPFDIGYRIVRHELDAVEGRNLSVSVWYPAAPGVTVDRMRFRDYVLEVAPDEAPEALRTWLSRSISGDAGPVARETLDAILGAPMRAVRDAPEADRAFPLALWTTRHHTSVAQSVLGEYLASHGYVVASVGYTGPLPWEIESADEKTARFAELLDELESALVELMADPAVDDRIAVLTWSYAAEFAPRIQMRHPEIELVISLSSNPFSDAGVFQGDAAGTILDPQRLDATYVVMTERIGADGSVRDAPEILDALPTTSYFVRFDELAHGNFNVLEGMIPGVFGIDQVQPWSQGGPTARIGYETIARFVLAFLENGAAVGDPVDPNSLPWMPDLPSGFVTTTRFGR